MYNAFLQQFLFLFYFILLLDFLLHLVGTFYNITPTYTHHKKLTPFAYLQSFYGLIDFLSATLFVLALIKFQNSDLMLILSLMSILKIAKYSPAIIILKDVLKNESKTLLAALYIMVILTLITSTTVYFLERDVNPGFDTLLNSIWWSAITLSTVGFGDVVPITPFGKLFGVLASISGFGMFALPAGILANGFASEIKRLKEIATWNMLEKVPLFSHMDSHTIYELAELLKVKIYRKNEIIIKEKDIGDTMYFIIDGRVEVLTKGVDVYLKKGDFFGEVALIEEIPRTATIIAKTRCELLELSKYNFQNFINSKPNLLKQIQQVKEQRYHA